MAYLKLVAGCEPGKEFEIPGVGQATIGRSGDCHVALDVAAVSRHHAAVVAEGGQFYVEDLGSRNGTLLDGQPVVGRTPLRDGSAISVCDQEFTFHIHRTPSLMASPTRNDESSLAQLVSDDEEEGNSRASVMGTIDLGSGSIAWNLSAKPEVKLAAMVEISHALAQSISLSEMLPHLLESLFKVFVQADRGFVIMRPNPEAPLTPVAAKSRRESQEGQMRISRTIIEEAINSKQAILSADAASDERFGMAQSIADFQIRSMICAPMLGSDGEPVGLIQIDTMNQRSRFTQDDLEVLAAVASQAGVAIDNASLHEAAAQQRALERDLQLAARMQRALLPNGPPQAPGYSFFAYYESARQVGGDYYDYIALPGGRLAVVVGDVAGKGVSAAILMARISSDVRFALATESDLAKALMLVNMAFASRDVDDRFVTMVVAVIDPATHEMQLVNAGHMPPLLRNAKGKVSEIGESIAGLPLGVYDGYEYESFTHTMQPGDFVTMFTDGFSEAMNSARDLYGMERLIKVVGEGAVSLDELGSHILDDVHKFVGGHPQSDDMCLACFGRTD
ncbi:Phosphoserine phosphatase RsbU [Pirellulimonas nuda]|uniref:Phosphoserine phosphatase RsbU n=1 Tax=Pirellulimonas nuda TaxID=2528009 RepID=A0A518D8K5_9BACT|nr:SpoIIE family protein phosphatase [Pirellulimonas nuda]QDU87808.1 Phosphoserine phosphatase RsbU [Pirellulimonas nuda]